MALGKSCSFVVHSSSVCSRFDPFMGGGASMFECRIYSFSASPLYSFSVLGSDVALPLLPTFSGGYGRTIFSCVSHFCLSFSKVCIIRRTHLRVILHQHYCCVGVFQSFSLQDRTGSLPVRFRGCSTTMPKDSARPTTPYRPLGL